MKQLASVAMSTLLASCGGSSWPKDKFPAEMSVERILFAEDDGLMREACVAKVAELTDAAATRVIFAPNVFKEGPHVASPANGWSPTPIPEKGAGRTFYEGAFGGCNNGRKRPLGDLPGALKRPGAFYKIINGGEGILIIVPRSKLAGFFYVG